MARKWMVAGVRMSVRRCFPFRGTVERRAKKSHRERGTRPDRSEHRFPAKALATAGVIPSFGAALPLASTSLPAM